MNFTAEESEQIALIQWRDLNLIRYPELERLIHIANQGKRPAMVGHKLKLMGLLPGTWDLFLPVVRLPWHGLWIEMKSKTGRLEKTQKSFQEMLKDDYAMRACWGWEAARDTMVEYLEGMFAK